MHVSVAAETIFHIGPFPITNSFLTTIIVTLFLVFIAYKTNANIKSGKPSALQSIMEIVIGALLGLTEDVAGKEFGRKIFPLLATFFIFIMISNWSGLIPGVGSIGVYEKVEHGMTITDPNAVYAKETNIEEVDGEKVLETTATEHEEEITTEEHGEAGETEEVLVPLFRGPTADLNVTIALALISVFMIQYYGIKQLGLSYLKKFFNFSNPINAFIGILELVSDFSKIISFAFRLYGNIFAGEVLLTVIATLVPFIAPLPFIGLEIFVGFIQALVFMMLSLVFINMATIAEH